MDIKNILEDIYQSRRDDLLIDIVTQKKPSAFILGGQPASGKSNLANIISKENPTKKILYINGDIYREYHPNFAELRQLPELFSKETQIISNYFTERLIEEALKKKFDIIIEGTMRNPNIPVSTAQMFKNANFSISAYAIAAPALFTELGLYTRYQEEVNMQGWGRLADIESHNQAVIGLPHSLDLLFSKKLVDDIHLYTYQGKSNITNFQTGDSKNKLPSDVLNSSRLDQLLNKEVLQNIIDRGNITYREIEHGLKGKIDEILTELEKRLEELQNENKKGFRR